MTKNRKQSEPTEYFAGGLAELVPSPTALTYSFLKEWFSGAESLGYAMQLLGLPYEKSDLSVLELYGDDLVTNLVHEEKTLYTHTLFTYQKQKNTHTTPKLTIDITKLFSLRCVFNTLRILIKQSQWIAQPQASITYAKHLIASIPESSEEKTIEDINLGLAKQVWPYVIAVGFLSEFYQQFLMKETKEIYNESMLYISQEIAKKDWFFRSISQQMLVKQGKMSFKDYMNQYGMRADKDYELASPRWHEIPEVIKKRIILAENKHIPNQAISIPQKYTSLIETVIQLQLLRSEAKRKTLRYIDMLRSTIVQKVGVSQDIIHFTKDELLKVVPLTTKRKQKIEPKKIKKQTFSSKGKGMGVSMGNINGIAQHISDNDIRIPKGTIGIFPNASPEFAIQYPKCSGMVFLKGGQTSHGAIVAREFGIPALIDQELAGIKNGQILHMNGATGEWSIL